MLVGAFSCIIQILRKDIDLRVIFHNIFTSAWYIDVIILEYIFFALANDIERENKKIRLCIIVLLNFMLALIFKIIGLDERWYNAVMLFPFGIWVAYKECEILCVIRKKQFLVGITGLIVYVLLGSLASAWKGMPVAVLLKMVAGIALIVGICCVMTRICLNSIVTGHIGKCSLYYYIIHVELIILCSDLGIKSPITEVWIIIIITVILGELCNWFLGRNRE